MKKADIEQIAQIFRDLGLAVPDAKILVKQAEDLLASVDPGLKGAVAKARRQLGTINPAQLREAEQLLERLSVPPKPRQKEPDSVEIIQEAYYKVREKYGRAPGKTAVAGEAKYHISTIKRHWAKLLKGPRPG